MNKISIMIVMLLSFELMNGQNMVDNGSFEDGNYNGNIYPVMNYKYNLNDWTSDSYIPLGGGETGHSPDWYFEDFSYPMLASNGDYFAGMASYEMMMQNLGIGQQFTSGNGYKFSVHVYLKDVNFDYENHVLKFYLSKNKISYDADVSCIECEDGNMDYKLIGNSEIKCIHTFDLEDLNKGEWIKLSFLYIEPEIYTGLNNYNWLGLQIISDASNCRGNYIYVDKVVIKEVDYCTFDQCSSIEGPEVATPVYRYGDPNGPAAVSGLDNIQSAEDIKIYDINGSLIETIPDVYSLNGISSPIFWDGKNNGGLSVPNGTYIWKMNLINNCGTHVYEEAFVVSSSFSYSQLPQFPQRNNDIVTPLPCCVDQEDILIDYDLYGPGLIEFVAKKSITLRDMSVENTVDQLYIQAGETVVIETGVTIEVGCEVTIDIETCELEL